MLSLAQLYFIVGFIAGVSLVLLMFLLIKLMKWRPFK